MRQKLVIGINTLTSVDENVYANHLDLFYHLGTLKDRFEVILFSPTRMSIDRMRNEAGKLALNIEASHLVFIDDDMLLQRDTIEQLIDADKDIIMAHTYIRGHPFNPMAFKLTKDSTPAEIGLEPYIDVWEYQDENKLVKCDAIGFACVAIKTDLLRRMESPWFITGPCNTEDIYFCVRCMKELGDISTYVHCGCPTGHKLGSEFVHPENVEKLRTYYKPEVKDEAKSRGDRQQNYHEMIAQL